MSQHEITRAQWVAITGWTDPSDVAFSSGMTDPVQKVSWYDAIAFCNKLSLLESLEPVYTVSGVDFTALTYVQIPTSNNTIWNAVTTNDSANGYRLPTEMEWMWAAMGADTVNPGAVNTTGYSKAFAGSTGSNLIGDYAVFGYGSGEAGATTTLRSNPVGSKLANELGLYDLTGNVLEWVWDWYGTFPTGTVTDYRGPASGFYRTERGGSWNYVESSCTLARQAWDGPSGRSNTLGFRVVRN
jgi:formylglycine-generating enzyme required for sulfatase activity